jgi:DNA-binding NarL/FixJ family response regulator
MPDAGREGAHVVLVVDRDKRARRELAEMLTTEGFGVLEAASGEEALAVAALKLPDVILLEVPLGKISGYEVCRSLRQELGDEVAIVFVSGARKEAHDRVAGLLLGADDYVAKPYAVDELLVRVRHLLDRKQPASGTLTRLTPRELEVLQLLAEGLSASEVAQRLFISVKTVRTHVEHILSKLDVKSRVQAVAIAFREGLTRPRELKPVD